MDLRNVNQRSLTTDTGATMSTVRLDLVNNRQPLISSCTIQTVTGSPVKVLGKVDVRVPVSYTHLDVYKRQDYSIAVNRSCRH